MNIPVKWLSEGIASIPLRNEPMFHQLWDDGRLRCGTSAGDAVDRSNARLASSTLERGFRLFIVLPDDLPQRAPLLFASSLVYQWLDRKDRDLTPGRVLYFGSTVGIREHLSNTKIRNLILDKVFPQSNPTLSSTSLISPSRPSDSGLPEVICAYSPADPIALIKRYRPAWIAIDCGNQRNVRWLSRLLKHLKNDQTPIIAWSYNPLSETIREFEQFGGGKVIRWPFRTLAASSLTVVPVILKSSDSHFEDSLQEAYRILAKATAKHNTGRLATDALKIIWGLHRSLERLIVPFDLFETEADHYWGVRSITNLLHGVQRFIATLESQNPQLFQHLSDALLFYERIMQFLRESEPPLWTALSQLCVEDVPTDGVRILVFSSKARKEMFALALLSRFNFSEDDLSDIGVFLSSLTELQNKLEFFSQYSSDQRSILLVGIPSHKISSGMLPLLLLEEFETLVYSFQVATLSRRIKEWNLALSFSRSTAEEVIRARSGEISPLALPTCGSILTLGENRGFSIDSGKVTKAFKSKHLIPDLDEAAEVSWLFEDDVILESEHRVSDIHPTDISYEDIWTEEAFEIHVNGGGWGLFALDDKLNVVVKGANGECTEERFVQALRTGDRILFIHGQRRQDLYELIISRIHNHQAIEIHLALINRWQEELTHSFRKFQKNGRTIEDLLALIQDLGSSITSSQTIRLWLSRQVHAPRDPKDLLRLAESMDMPFVKEYHSRIDKAAKRIRGLHRGLSNRLNNWLQEQASGATDTAFEIFDPELGLSFQDFRDSLAIYTVERTEKISGLFLRQGLGTLEWKR